MNIYATVAQMETVAPDSEPALAYCLATNLYYAYHSNPATSFGVLPADNNIDFLSTGNGGNTRWIAYNYQGTYTPTLAANANITGTPTCEALTYIRVGRGVRFGGWTASATPTAAGTNTAFTMTLPYTASANFANNTEADGYAWIRAWGSNTATAWSPGTLRALAGTKTIIVEFMPDDTTARAMTITGGFLLL